MRINVRNIFVALVLATTAACSNPTAPSIVRSRTMVGTYALTLSRNASLPIARAGVKGAKFDLTTLRQVLQLRMDGTAVMTRETQRTHDDGVIDPATNGAAMGRYTIRGDSLYLVLDQIGPSVNTDQNDLLGDYTYGIQGTTLVIHDDFMSMQYCEHNCAI